MSSEIRQRESLHFGNMLFFVKEFSKSVQTFLCLFFVVALCFLFENTFVLKWMSVFVCCQERHEDGRNIYVEV